MSCHTRCWDSTKANMLISFYCSAAWLPHFPPLQLDAFGDMGSSEAVTILFSARKVFFYKVMVSDLAF